MKIELSQDTPKHIELYCTSWRGGKVEHDRAVFFSIHDHTEWRAGASFTPNEARAFAQALTDHANHIDEICGVKQS